MPKIDQNGKGLAFTLCWSFAIFQLFKNGSIRPKTTLGVFENDSERG